MTKLTADEIITKVSESKLLTSAQKHMIGIYLNAGLQAAHNAAEGKMSFIDHVGGQDSWEIAYNTLIQYVSWGNNLDLAHLEENNGNNI